MRFCSNNKINLVKLYYYVFSDTDDVDEDVYIGEYMASLHRL